MQLTSRTKSARRTPQSGAGYFNRSIGACAAVGGAAIRAVPVYDIALGRPIGGASAPDQLARAGPASIPLAASVLEVVGKLHFPPLLRAAAQLAGPLELHKLKEATDGTICSLPGTSWCLSISS